MLAYSYDNSFFWYFAEALIVHLSFSDNGLRDFRNIRANVTFDGQTQSVRSFLLPDECPPMDAYKRLTFPAISETWKNIRLDVERKSITNVADIEIWGYVSTDSVVVII